MARNGRRGDETGIPARTGRRVVSGRQTVRRMGTTRLPVVEQEALEAEGVRVPVPVGGRMHETFRLGAFPAE